MVRKKLAMLAPRDVRLYLTQMSKSGLIDLVWLLVQSRDELRNARRLIELVCRYRGDKHPEESLLEEGGQDGSSGSSG